MDEELQFSDFPDLEILEGDFNKSILPLQIVKQLDLSHSIHISVIDVVKNSDPVL